VKRSWDSPSLRTTVVYGAAGAGVAGLAFAVVGALAYDLSPSLLQMPMVSSIAGGAMVVAGAQIRVRLYLDHRGAPPVVALPPVRQAGDG
jgi:hypothetical protein